MNKVHKALMLSLLLSAGCVGKVQAMEQGVQAGGAEPQVQAFPNLLDNDSETFWRIQNMSDQVVRVASDIDFLVLQPKSDYRLDRNASFNISVNGKQFTTQNHVIVFFTNPATGGVALEEFPIWDKAKGFGFAQYGLGLGVGLTKGGFWGGRRLGWRGFHRGIRPQACVGVGCVRGARVGIHGGRRGSKMHGGGRRRGEGRHGGGRGGHRGRR